MFLEWILNGHIFKAELRIFDTQLNPFGDDAFLVASFMFTTSIPLWTCFSQWCLLFFVDNPNKNTRKSAGKPLRKYTGGFRGRHRGILPVGISLFNPLHSCISPCPASSGWWNSWIWGCVLATVQPMKHYKAQNMGLVQKVGPWGLPFGSFYPLPIGIWKPRTDLEW